MRVPSLAALAVICAACADGPSSAITSPGIPSFAISGTTADQIAYCQLSQASLTLDPGTSAQLAIDCFDAAGRLLGHPSPTHASYASANPFVATVSSSGLITGKSAGTTIVRAWHPERPFNDSITVTIRGATTSPPAPDTTTAPVPDTTGTSAPPDTTSSWNGTPPPPIGPPAPTAGYPNQPSGMILITNRQFDSKASDNDDRGSSGSDGWDGVEYRYPRFTIVSDPSAPNGDGKVGQMFFPSDLVAGTGPGIAQVYFPSGLRQLYVSIWARISPNWVGNQSSTNKMFFLGVAGGNNQFFLSAEGAGSNPLYPQLRLQGVEDPRARIHPNRNSMEIVRGAWQRWEFVFKCNSGMYRADGAIDLWINGTHVTSVSDVDWTHSKYPSRPCDMNMFNWNPTYGGGGASPGVDQFLWFDRVYISGK